MDVVYFPSVRFVSGFEWPTMATEKPLTSPIIAASVSWLWRVCNIFFFRDINPKSILRKWFWLLLVIADPTSAAKELQ